MTAEEALREIDRQEKRLAALRIGISGVVTRRPGAIFCYNTRQ